LSQTFHVEALGVADRDNVTPVVQRMSVQAQAIEGVQRRAIRLLQRSRTAQWNLGPVEAVRIVDGAGTELFRWSIWDELSGARHG
jgi:hypothetical protein